MAKADQAAMERERAGLCADCAHARKVESARGSIFLLCQLSLTDSRYAKYPPLPVLSCHGYVKSGGQPEAL